MSLVENLKFKYSSGDFNLNIPRWEIPDQGITALMGPSGSGKSTLFRILIGLEPCSHFNWVMDGVDLAELPVEKRGLGVVFQNFQLFPHLTAKKNIIFAAKARKIEKKRALDKLEELVTSLKLGDCLNTRAALLSGGEKQRTSLARALMSEPKFLFLDEPFNALDAELREESRQLVKRIIEENDIPTLLITHDIEDVKALAQTCFDMDMGEIKLRESFSSQKS